MKAELVINTDELRQQITQDVIKALKPLLSGKGEDDSILDVDGLAKYLKVDESWVYKQVSLKTIPYFKTGKYTRFRQAAVDKWIDSQTVRPASPFTLLKRDKAR